MRRVQPKGGAERIRSGYLFLPKTLKNSGGFRETRWLERATWKETYELFYADGGGWWNAREWVDE